MVIKCKQGRVSWSSSRSRWEQSVRSFSCVSRQAESEARPTTIATSYAKAGRARTSAKTVRTDWPEKIKTRFKRSARLIQPTESRRRRQGAKSSSILLAWRSLPPLAASRSLFAPGASSGTVKPVAPASRKTRGCAPPRPPLSIAKHRRRRGSIDSRGSQICRRRA